MWPEQPWDTSCRERGPPLADTRVTGRLTRRQSSQPRPLPAPSPGPLHHGGPSSSFPEAEAQARSMSPASRHQMGRCLIVRDTAGSPTAPHLLPVGRSQPWTGTTRKPCEPLRHNTMQSLNHRRARRAAHTPSIPSSSSLGPGLRGTHLHSQARPLHASGGEGGGGLSKPRLRGRRPSTAGGGLHIAVPT